MTAAEIADALGGTSRSNGWWRCRCPIHASSGPTLALRDGERGLIVKCWAGCHPRDVLVELRRRDLLNANAGDTAKPPDPAAERRRHESEAVHRQQRITLARDMWRSAIPASGTVVERYLRSRGIEIPVPPSIRFIGMHTSYGRHGPSGDRRPVMVAAVEHVDYGPVGVSRTFLAIDGSCKATLDPPRLFTGPVAGGAVRLAPATETLLVGEGIETCLAAMQATAMPAWAALSTSGLIALVLPSIVRNIVILTDNDANGAGKRAAYTAADRWLAEDRRVRIAMPPQPGTDFADVLLGRLRSKVRDVAA
jgi:putative DNA primase/helicase